MKGKKISSAILFVSLLLLVLMSAGITSAMPSNTPDWAAGYDATAASKAVLKYRHLFYPSKNGFEASLGPCEPGQCSFTNGVTKDFYGTTFTYQQTNHLVVSYDGVNKFTTTVSNSSSGSPLVMEYTAEVNPGELNYLQLTLRGQVAAIGNEIVSLKNITLDTHPLTDVTGSTSSQDWNISGLDLTNGFTLEGDIELTYPFSNTGCDECNRLVLRVGYVVPNEPPVAEANGPYVVEVGKTLALDSTGSYDPDGDPLTETWTVTGVPALGTITASTTFTAGPDAGITEVTLRVDDDRGGTATDTAMVVVYDPDGGFVTGGGWIVSPAAVEPLGIVRDGVAFDEHWVFNGEPPYVTPAGFSSDKASKGSGSLHVEPITNVLGNEAKFILRYVPDTAILLSELDNFSIDFLIDDAGTSFAPNQFYINLYAMTPDPSDGGWYDCRFDYVATTGSTVDWTPLAFDGSTTATAIGDKIGGACPSSYAGMPPGSTVLYLSVNLGDTSGNDTGVGGYFDNALMTVAGSTTSWDLGEGLAKANFGFVSKYKRGATVPTGNTEFVFQEADLNFHSTSYDWLLVTGSDYAKFKGEGTINGMPELYKFQIWAGDGTGTDGADTFRIKIWDDAGVVIYDNGMNQDIGGGNIVVHSGKSR